MKKLSFLFLNISVCLVFVANTTFAKNSTNSSNGGQNNPGSNQNTPSLAAGCAVASASRDLDLNNVRALIHTGGDMWWDLVGSPRYEIPKGSGNHSMFSGALWMGGVDVNGQLKLAAQRFRNKGNDYWPGPLNKITVDIDAPTCYEYDKFFVTTRAEVEEFNAWFLATQDNPAQAALDFPGYLIPKSILDWPAHGNPGNNEGYYLAPYFKRDGSTGAYNPYDGDYPGYELVSGGECGTTRDVKLYGDKNLWWVFNDKGNVHTETGGSPIGMEVRAQAFAFSTNDEINNMTFYNYELINRSTFSLENTYFGVWADADLGFYDDDFVGCDVQRGLGYAYNGAETDGTGAPGHYKGTPPAIGIDFFEGPYQDNDGIDNPLVYDYNLAKAGNGIPYSGLGIGYGDGIIDNERFGMSRFLYHNKGGQGANAIQEPETAPDYYNFLRGIWKDNTKMVYGGNGHVSGGGVGECNYMFPGTTDPIGWGTNGAPQLNWTEETALNVAADRRFAQSAGPFVLKPGAVNNITVGVVWAQALSGGPFASVEKLKIVDDKAQSLFDNCFRILNGPDAPELTIKELDKELILYLSNPRGNNVNESYIEKDYTIPSINIETGQAFDQFYRFQGYLIYQVKDGTVTADEIGNPDRARLTAQVDIKDGVSRLINFKFDENILANVPEDVIINGTDKGIYHSFRILEDKFALNAKKLVNHKPYYFLAIAYAYNNFKQYNPLQPSGLDGQTKTYKLSRKTASGSIKAFKAVPHNSSPRETGILVNSSYGDQPIITRIEGQGNGGLNIEFSAESEAQIFSAGKIEFPVYKKGFGPVDIKVVDPLNVPDATFEIKLNVPGTSSIDTASWILTNTSAFEVDGQSYAAGEFVVNSGTSIKVAYEQLIPAIGLSIRIEQAENPGIPTSLTNGYIGASMEFNDEQNRWLTGVSDAEQFSQTNWIRSGTFDDTTMFNYPYNKIYFDYGGKDDKEIYEKVLNGTWAPYGLTSVYEHGPAIPVTGGNTDLSKVKSVDVVITDDKTKWTRCPVLENQFNPLLSLGGAVKNGLRKSPSVNKDGIADGSGNGMGWFPGYAVCVETGERLNMAFSEDTWLGDANGRDMLWNPTSVVYTNTGQIRGGGKHFIYVFNKRGNLPNQMPAYDEGEKLKEFITAGGTALREVWNNCMWVGYPLLVKDKKLLGTEVKIKLRVSRKYEKYETSSVANDKNPLYSFDLKDLATEKGSSIALDSALSLVNVVPNPYYAYSGYETNQLDNRIKIINLPVEASVTIYTVNGTLIRKFAKADKTTSLEWDLKNHAGIPISGGVYLIHVSSKDETGVLRERVLKWFGIMRPVDLDSF
ncbi:MAG: T9SS type A sorting domain-containing protein [Bacteroidetes bacterium]|nr:T9SS type A sorting domain-containing protein [Bacteroidota bacterium]HET6243485.1 T9SS type A sorting domain-containing protein [Bacteroidia bacterium]